MSLILPRALLVVAQYALALPTTNITSTDAGIISAGLPSCDNIHRCRTFINLVWSCLNTIILSTWVTIHPDVPDKGETTFGAYIGHLAGMLIAPEYLVLLAFNTWTESCKLIKTLSEQYPDIKWTETHGMMAVMSGFEVVKEGDGKKTRLNYENFEKSLEGYKVDFSEITQDVILDRSKGSAIAKVLVMFQTSWFTIQCTARAIKGLPLTELELTTLGHTVFVSAIYFFWWNKPLDVRFPFTLQAHRPKNANGELSTEGRAGPEGSDDDTNNLQHPVDASCEISAEARAGDGDSDAWRRLESSTLIPIIPPSKPRNYHLSWRIRLGNYLHLDNITSVRIRSTSVMSDLLRLTFVLLISGTFGAIHCLGWNSHFPSHVEQTLWRASAVIVTVIPVMILTGTDMWQELSGIFLAFPYIFARICLITLAFLALRDLTQAVYQTPSWVSFIPHFQL